MGVLLIVVILFYAGAYIVSQVRRKGRGNARTPPLTPKVEPPRKLIEPRLSSPAKPPAAPRLAFDVRDVEVNDDFQLALDLIEKRNESLFVTGKAGTGKSTLLRYFRATTTKSVVVLAPTGLAAVNVGGQTIHSFFRFPPRLIDPKSLRPSSNSALLRRLETLVIDEVSMVRADLMDGIDNILRLSRGRPDEPFGGVQVIMIGDLFQLPPVVREQELKNYFTNRYGGVYFFRAPVFTAKQFYMIDLQKVYRQTDANFIGLLNCIRERQLDDGVLELLNARVRKFDDLVDPEGYITLTPTNDAASRINMTFLERLSGPVYTFESIVSGQFDPSSFPTDSSLLLKVGARVMMIRNDPNKRWVNGTLGVVGEVSSNKVSVTIDGVSYKIQRHTWENVKYVLNPQENRPEPRVIGTFQQYPLRLAWALTIHKSQGLTLERIYLDLGTGAFAHGQTYVAFSRCRSLGGIALGRPVFETDVIFDKAIYDYQRVFTPIRATLASTTSSIATLESTAPVGEVSPNPQANAFKFKSIRLVVAQAYSQKHRLWIEYTKPGLYGQQPETTTREIDVYAMGEIYLDAFCHLRQERRTFKLDRIASAHMLQSSYLVPKDYTPSIWVLRIEETVDSDE